MNDSKEHYVEEPIWMEEKNTEALTWPAAFVVVGCLALICGTVCFVAWMVWG